MGDPRGATRRCAAHPAARARVSHSTDEGYSARTAVVSIADGFGERAYLAYMSEDSRDCDGPHEWASENVYRPRRKAQRFYMSHDWTKGKPSGKFYTRRWVRIAEGRTSQRDGFAEAAGY